MDDHILLTSIVTISLLLLTTLPQSLSQSQPHPPISYYWNCGDQPYDCGTINVFDYPFWGLNRVSNCGGGNQFQLHCDLNNQTSIRFGTVSLRVLEIDTTAHTITMVRTDLTHDVCSPQFEDIVLSPNFQYPVTLYDITIFYNCTSLEVVPRGNTCSYGGNKHSVYYVGMADELLNKYSYLKSCERHLQVPGPGDFHHLDPSGSLDALKEALQHGFQVNYLISEECVTCQKSGGVCGTSLSDQYQFTCYCRNQSINGLDCYPYHEIAGSTNAWKRKVVIGVAGAAIGGILIGIIISCFKFKPAKRQIMFWLTTESNRDIEAFLNKHGTLPLKRYKFMDVKKMTNSFKVKLGKGGFGVVYKGKLLTGCPVAVKILNESKGNGEEFINEVASISKTSHVNVVTLLGFCLEGRKKVLIYEFMANGSLENFIYKKGPQTTLSLSWDNLYHIAIGIARGLEYLHKGCNTRILHLDIKPHNILLDENFCPKISDFGLAKLCLKKESIISLSDARGTMGYVAPEVWNRHFGGVSHKSDVYSYGMMLLEMVGGRKNINAEASHTSEIYFPHWVYRRLELGSNLGPNGVVASKENEITKRMTVVGLWCIQTFPHDRPTMSRVVDMLEGSMNSLEMPPKPILSSPTRSVVGSSTTLN